MNAMLRAVLLIAAAASSVFVITTSYPSRTSRSTLNNNDLTPSTAFAPSVDKIPDEVQQQHHVTILSHPALDTLADQRLRIISLRRWVAGLGLTSSDVFNNTRLLSLETAHRVDGSSPRSPVRPVEHVMNITCPKQGDVSLKIVKDNTATDTDLKTSFVVRKYESYAPRCRSTGGIMWAYLTPGMQTRVFTKVAAAFLGLAVPPRTIAEMTSKHEMEIAPADEANNATRRPLYILDWGSGCGLALRNLEDIVQRFVAFHGRPAVEAALGFALPSAPPFVEGLGVDIVPSAVAYAQRKFNSSVRQYCHGDGMQLDGWVPDDQFDWVMSYGSLSHVPDAARCRVVNMLIRKLRTSTTGGHVWTGYVPPGVALRFTQCALEGMRSEETVVNALVGVVNDREAWRGDKVHKFYLEEFQSVLWRIYP